MNTAPPAGKAPRQLLRTAGSLLGLSVFNLFMVIPGLVYACLLSAVYIMAFALYIGGVAVTASGLSGQNEVALQGPLHHLQELARPGNSNSNGGGDDPQGWRVTIGNTSVRVERDSASTTPVQNDNNSGASSAESRNSRIWDRAEAVVTGDLRIKTDVDGDARTTQTMFGFAMILGGIGLCLLSVVLTRYTVVGLRRYVAMNVALLRGN
ncbi:MAG: hypothetical protein ABW202_19320 [Duganella sp.]